MTDARCRGHKRICSLIEGSLDAEAAQQAVIEALSCHLANDNHYR